MKKCFVCKDKLNNKNHYLCRNCYDLFVEYYNQLLESDIDMDEFCKKNINNFPHNLESKRDYICTLWYLTAEYNEDDIVEFLLGNLNKVTDVSLSTEKYTELKKENKELRRILSELEFNESNCESKYKNRKFPCEDGHVVKSNAELRIDQFLYKNNIVHAYEKTITLKDGKQIHPDFYIPEIDVYIEYHGVRGSAWYDKMNEYKDGIYKNEDITVIVITHEKEEQIEKLLPVLLNQNGLNRTFK